MAYTITARFPFHTETEKRDSPLDAYAFGRDCFERSASTVAITDGEHAYSVQEFYRAFVSGEVS